MTYTTREIATFERLATAAQNAPRFWDGVAVLDTIDRDVNWRKNMERAVQYELFSQTPAKAAAKPETATQILDRLLNGTVGKVDENCGICGGQLTEDYQEINKWARPTFTDLDKVTAPRVCGPCIRCTDGKPPDTFRLYTVMYRDDCDFVADSHHLWKYSDPHLRGYNKKDLSEVLRVLRDPPKCRWFLACADSGQIHILPWTPVNNGAGSPQFRLERVPIQWSPAAVAPLIDSVQALVNLGFPKGAIIDCAPTSTHLVKLGLDAWREHAPTLEKWSRSPLLRLVALCVRKEEDDGTGT